MSRRLVAFVVLLAWTGSAPAEEVRPNVVLIVADDLGWADLGCYGSTYHKTPNLDRLAMQGTRFTHAYAACPVCSPSRAAMLTGRYPARLHLTDWLPGRADRPTQKMIRPIIRQALPLEETTIAEAVAAVGYDTATMGKWHLGGDGFLPEQQGFAVNVGGTATGSPPGGYFRFKTPTLAARADDEYLTDRLGEEAAQYIDAHRDKPFFLYLPHYAVHTPLQARAEAIARYKAATPKAGSKQNNPTYAAMMESLDDAVGRVLKALDDAKLADRTVVIFTSDNGGLSVKEGPGTPSTSNAPLRDGKGYLHEGGIRVPLIVRWPGVTQPGAITQVPASGQDLFPTVLTLAGTKPAPNATIDGVDLVPVLRGSGTPRREALFWHYPHYSNQGGKPGGAILQGYRKLIENYEDGRLELYDVAIDPMEVDDLAADHPEEAARLRDRLAAWRASVDAQMPTPNPDYTPPGK
ncbi:sulfatase [Tundrisphaera sp. TA3]|uniref:sulfatase n=1 Tax=Tundrisphaera sp. TA3 TaxID=3435775 RepID=UPI003EC15213